MNYQSKIENANQDSNFKQQQQCVEDEMSLFKKKSDVLNANRLSDYKSFKIPLMQTACMMAGNENVNTIVSRIIFHFYYF